MIERLNESPINVEKLGRNRIKFEPAQFAIGRVLHQFTSRGSACWKSSSSHSSAAAALSDRTHFFTAVEPRLCLAAVMQQTANQLQGKAFVFLKKQQQNTKKVNKRQTRPRHNERLGPRWLGNIHLEWKASKEENKIATSTDKTEKRSRAQSGVSIILLVAAQQRLTSSRSRIHYSLQIYRGKTAAQTLGPDFLSWKCRRSRNGRIRSAKNQK